jgi:predicted amidophosphoribosyltransferase
MLRDALLDALALLLPVTCAGCGGDDRALCAACAAALVPAPVLRELADGTPMAAGLAYDGVARAVVAALKADRPGLARRFVPALAAAVAAAAERAGPADRAGPAAGLAGPAPLELAAVPSTRRARRRRGYDPVRLLLARAGFRVAPVFRTARPHAAQKTLARAERAAGLDGVFAARGPLDGRRFLLVDDVVTTGATLLAAAAALRAAGAEVPACAAVASTPRRRA